MTTTDKREAKFTAARERMEKRTRGVVAYAIIDPKHIDSAGRVVITRRDGGERGVICEAVAWIPYHGAGRADWRHIGRATGMGYDMASAAMSGAKFKLDGGEPGALHDRGGYWYHQLEDAGFVVLQIV